MIFTPEQFAAAQKRQIETVLAISQKAFEGVEKVVALNLQATKAALEEAGDVVVNAKDPQALFTAQGELLQPAAEKAAAYGRELYEITSQSTAEFSRYTEESVAAARKQLLAFIDSAVKNAPAGSENVANLFKTSVIAANEAFDGAQRLAKQATESVEANVSALAANAGKVAKAAPAKAKRG
jgi:phasin family protein